MTGLKIIVHAIGIIFSNFTTAARISLLPWIVSFGLSYWVIGRLAIGANRAEMDSLSDIPVFSIALMFAVTALLYMWIAVSWHRFILLEEQPGMFLPVWRGREVGQYFIQSLIVGLAILLVGILTGLLSMLLVIPLAGILAQSVLLKVVTAFLVVFPILYIFLRLSPILPAAALGKKMPLGEATSQTGRIKRAIVGLAVYSSIANVLLNNLLLSFMAASGTILSVLLVQAGVQWLSMLIGVSIITVLYGYLIEGREIS